MMSWEMSWVYPLDRAEPRSCWRGPWNRSGNCTWAIGRGAKSLLEVPGVKPQVSVRPRQNEARSLQASHKGLLDSHAKAWGKTT